LVDVQKRSRAKACSPSSLKAQNDQINVIIPNDAHVDSSAQLLMVGKYYQPCIVLYFYGIISLHVCVCVCVCVCEREREL
jgi:hypothetical protein